MPRLPPVAKSRHTRLRATFWPGVGNSVVTFDQSHSSSSATSWARPVRVPWPISERAMRITTVSSGCTTTQALTSGAALAGCAACASRGRRRPMASPPPMAALRMRKVLRSISMALMAASSSFRGGVDRLAHLLEGAAAADVGDGGVDVRVTRLRLALEQRRGRHEHPGLAVAALGHVMLDPGLLHLGQDARGRETLDGRDLLALHRGHGDDTGAHRLAIDMNGAGAALGDAATVLGSGEPGLFPDRPQQGCG